MLYNYTTDDSSKLFKEYVRFVVYKRNLRIFYTGMCL